MRRLLAGLMIAACVTARAETVDLRLVNDIHVRADYRQGQAGKPAILLVHGFLQTHESPTVHRLLGALKDAGYTVLAPNLSLGVTHRMQSLACEAIHTHTMTDDTREMDAWVNWLAKKRPNGIILMGHSFGSVHLLAYLASRPNAPVQKAIGISIVEARPTLDSAARAQLLASLQQKIKQGDRNVISQPFSFCRAMRATPTALASYLEWTPERILNHLNQGPIPVTMIMGGNDDRLGPGWTDRLKKTRARVHIVKGANHFMDGEHEFDLHDLVLSELDRL